MKNVLNFLNNYMNKTQKLIKMQKVQMKILNFQKVQKLMKYKMFLLNHKLFKPKIILSKILKKLNLKIIKKFKINVQIAIKFMKLK